MTKMNNKGFTLIEVMGVLILLVIILMITIPNITNTIKKSNLDSKKKYEETFCLGAKTYIVEEDITFTNSIEITGNKLISLNYIADSLTNPDNKKSALKESVILTRDSNGELQCSLK